VPFVNLDGVTLPAHKATFIAGISGVAVTGSTVVVGPHGKLGVAASSARFKEAIKPMDKASETILALRPVTFRYKKEIDPDSTPQFGLVAEEVEKVNPALVNRDADGKVFTVRYDAVNAMLLNEFLKERGKVQKLEATVEKQQRDFQAIAAQQQKQIEALTTGLQKVSARLEASKPAQQVVNNDQ
jgi:predicted ribosome quality control (RQC) complex YloA/Tae2 family protein